MEETYTYQTMPLLSLLVVIHKLLSPQHSLWASVLHIIPDMNTHFANGNIYGQDIVNSWPQTFRSSPLMNFSTPPKLSTPM